MMKSTHISIQYKQTIKKFEFNMIFEDEKCIGRIRRTELPIKEGNFLQFKTSVK